MKINFSAPASSNSKLARLPLALTFIAMCLAALTWLNHKANFVSQQQHFHYLQLLRDLEDGNSQTDSELLAIRLELVRNYDNLTRSNRQMLEYATKIASPPSFLADEDRARIAREAENILDLFRDKANKVLAYKRLNSVLRNSLAYFPVVAADLQQQGGFDIDMRIALESYAREVLAFTRAPDASSRMRIEAMQERLAAAINPDLRKAAGSLLLHGRVIVTRMGEFDLLTRQILGMHGARQLSGLIDRYRDGYQRAEARAKNYHLALYLLAVLLTFYLAWLYMRLERARHYLDVAHSEVSARYNAQLAAEKQLSLHATAFRRAHEGIILTDAVGDILDVNPAFTRITGWERSEVIGRNPRLLKSGRHDQAFFAAMWGSVLASGSWRGEVWNRNKYGEIYPELLSISAVRDDSGRLTNFVAVFSDIGRIKAQEKQLSQMAYLDALTNLPNRILLTDRLLQAMSQTLRTKSLLAVCCINLDGFKPLNDNRGREVGDQLLVEMAERLLGAMRGGDTIARLGGDEFVVLMLDINDIDALELAIQRLLELIARPLVSAPQPVSLSASIGVTLFPLDDADADSLLQHADQAMSNASKDGRNGYHIFDAIADCAVRDYDKNDRIRRIRQALENGEFELYYQPKVDMRKGEVIGLEALIRWNHPERGVVSPIEFLPLIEDDDLIKPVGDFVIETALIQLEQWRLEGLQIPVSVNIAGRQLQAPEFVQKLKVALHLHRDVAHLLELEILETAALEDIVRTSQVMDECREIGVHFSLDDFGTGYSSLTYLRRLPAESIKIDQGFVRNIVNDASNLVIAQAVIGLSFAFRRRVLAEGVETEVHGRMLMQLNCDLAQGYGIARPMPASEVPDWTRAWRPDPAWRSISHLYWDEADYPVLIAEVELRNWVEQLVYTVNQEQPPPHSHVGDPNRCQFGLWRQETLIKAPRHAAHEAFRRTDEPHQRLHEIAARMDADWRAGRLAAARKLIPQLLIARDEVLAALTELEIVIAENRPET